MGQSRGLSRMIAPFLNIKGVALSMAEFGLSDGHAPARPRAPRLALGGNFSPVFTVAELSIEQMDAAQAEWAELAARALEPNAFFEPGFALSAARHFPLKDRPRFIVVRDGLGRMAGLFPITPSSALGDRLIRLWLHKQAALATPLVNRESAAGVILTFLDWIEARSQAAGVVFARVTTGGRFHEALESAAAAGGRSVQILESFERAALLPGGDADELCVRAGSRKKLAELRRQSRRLREMGRVTFETHETAPAVRVAAEEFLALEASGWKAGRGALLSEAALATFLRSATRVMAQRKLCKIQSLRLDGRAIAMAIVLESQRRGYFWKIAFDEKLRSQAPGVLLTHELTKDYLSRPDLEMADSCAIADHPLIDRLWPDRIGMSDVAVQLQSGAQGPFLASCRKDGARRQIRDVAKRAANRLLNRKVS
jgi:CelD/BcsL family acetyltransferase involved in cellulose biosynthesis